MFYLDGEPGAVMCGGCYGHRREAEPPLINHEAWRKNCSRAGAVAARRHHGRQSHTGGRRYKHLAIESLLTCNSGTASYPAWSKLVDPPPPEAALGEAYWEGVEEVQTHSRLK